MNNFIVHIVPITILIFMLITFFISGIEKIFDWKGNCTFLKTHFSGTFLSKMIPFSLMLLIILDVAITIGCLISGYQLILYGEKESTVYTFFICCITLLLMLIGQRVAKDYPGALTISCYFMVAIFGLYISSI